MAAWSPTSEKEWAKRFGFVAVPLFGKQRQSPQAGEHFVLLDGQRSSLTFSRGNADSLLMSRHPMEWAWSANLRGSIVVDEKTATIRSVRWDQPADVREYRESKVDTLLKDIENTPLLEVETSIKRAMNIFRSVRQDVYEHGGNDLDAVHAFTVLLLLADSMRQKTIPNGVRMLGSATAELIQQGRLPIQPSTLSSNVSSLPIGDLAEQLLSSRDYYLLDPYLLIRHASGVLLEEAHHALTEPWQAQPKFFIWLRDHPAKPQGKATSDIHHTPTTLARFLTQQAVMEFRRLNPHADSVTVRDPACGSGVFIVEAIRELENTDLAMTITGVDSSPISAAMTRDVVKSALWDSVAAAKTINVDIINDDSLTREWGDSDIILMNPPFLPWRRIDSKTRSAIKTSLGDLFHGQSDTAIAFIAKAVRALKPGGVLATVMPAALLASKSASKLRSVLSGTTWRMVLLGRVRGYGYFEKATVEVAFLVVSRSTERAGYIRTVIAESDAVDRAIRAVRIMAPNKSQEGPGWELGTIDALNAENWNPRPARAKELLRRFGQNAAIRMVTDLFDVHLGIRTGANPVFIVPPSLVEEMQTAERTFFRPVADTIRHGRIQSPQFVFYPYDNGLLTVTSETQLKSLVPVFYSAQLEPNRSRLQNRRSRRSRGWWELSEPRLSWLRFGDPRLISASFVGRGAFAFDAAGEYAVVEGNAWIWKGSGDLSTEESFAYLAFLNSPIFEAVIDYFCPQVQGGQYEVAKRFMKNAPLPDMTLLAKQEKKELAEYGRAMHQGKRVPLHSLCASAATAFGVKLEDFITAFPLTPSARLEMGFEQLANKWKTETGMMSRLDRRCMHPTYQKIMAMGDSVLPFILQDLQDTRDDWLWALNVIAGEDSIPEDTPDNVDSLVEAWVSWGRANGYDV